MNDKQKIPIVLSVVSYFFFTLGLIAGLRGFAGIVVSRSDLPLQQWLALGLGVLYLYISRGLRRCSPKWHICAVTIICAAIILTIFQVGLFTLKNAHNITAVTLLSCVLALFFLFLICGLPLYILLRRDIRQLFYSNI
jgi:hypothetical protein